MVNQIEIYTGSDNQTQIEVQFENETVWLTLNQISVLFNRDKSVISRHLKNIFVSEELNRVSVVAKNATTATDGKNINRTISILETVQIEGTRKN